MLLEGTAIYAYIIMYGNYAGKTMCCLVHLHLEDVLGHLQTEWHVQETVTATMGILLGQVGRFLIKVYAQEASLASSLLKQVAPLSQ